MIVFEWVKAHPAVVTAMLAISVATLIGTALLLPLLVARMPADYFLGGSPRDWVHQHPALRLTLVGLKNALGVTLLLAGFAMLFLPGQGILTMLVGLGMTSFPGKRRLEVWIAQRKPVRRAVAWLRHRAGREPLRYPDDPPSSSDSLGG